MSGEAKPLSPAMVATLRALRDAPSTPGVRGIDCGFFPVAGRIRPTARALMGRGFVDGHPDYDDYFRLRDAGRCALATHNRIAGKGGAE